MTEPSSPFRRQLEAAARRLDALAKRSAPTEAAAIQREIVAVREASVLVEGGPCSLCEGRGRVVRDAPNFDLGFEVRPGTRVHEVINCPRCGGSGDL